MTENGKENDREFGMAERGTKRTAENDRMRTTQG